MENIAFSFSFQNNNTCHYRNISLFDHTDQIINGNKNKDKNINLNRIQVTTLITDWLFLTVEMNLDRIVSLI